MMRAVQVATTEDRWRLEITDLECKGIVLPLCAKSSYGAAHFVYE